MLEKLVMSQGMLSMGFTTKLMVCILISTICGKRKRIWAAFVANFIHFCIYNVVTLGILNSMYGENLWFRFVVATAGTGIALVIAVILSLVWKVHFFKLLTIYICSDAVIAMIVYIAGFLNPDPFFIFCFGMVALGILLRLGRPVFKKIRTIYFLNSWILGGFLLTVLVNSWLSNILYVWTDEMLVSNVMIYFGIGQILISLTFILLECLVYYIVLRQKQKMLLRNKDQMESYYRQVARHIREIGETRILLEQGTKLLSGADAASGVPQPFGVSKASGAGVPGRQMKREEQETVTAAPDSRAAMNPRQLQAYLAKLKSQYEALGEVFFCNDFAVDSVLRDYVVRCRKEGIKTDILFHEYQRGKVAAEDAAAILSRMLDYGIKAAKLPEDWKIQTAERHTVLQDKMVQTLISLHGASVKNQLLFSMTVTREGDRDADKNLLKIRIRKRSFNPWMRKYNGIVHVQREETRLQMVVGLENGKKQ